jgi:hypothetical protein
LGKNLEEIEKSAEEYARLKQERETTAPLTSRRAWTKSPPG